MILWCCSCLCLLPLIHCFFFSMKAKKHETQPEKDAAIHSCRFHQNECEHRKIELATTVAATASPKDLAPVSPPSSSPSLMHFFRWIEFKTKAVKSSTPTFSFMWPFIYHAISLSDLLICRTLWRCLINKFTTHSIFRWTCAQHQSRVGNSSEKSMSVENICIKMRRSMTKYLKRCWCPTAALLTIQNTWMMP